HVVWPPKGSDIVAVKRAVIEAQWRGLVALGAVNLRIASDPHDGLDSYAYRVANKNGWCFFEPADYDLVSTALGRKRRAWITAREREAQAQAQVQVERANVA